MPDIQAVRARLDAARDVPGILAAAWDAFEFTRAACAGFADPGSGLYAAFLFASAHAAAGRDAIGFAPSMPAGTGEPDGCGRGDGELRAAGLLAGLAAALAGQARAASRQAGLAGDQAALEQAAAQAESIRDLLSAGEQ